MHLFSFLTAVAIMSTSTCQAQIKNPKIITVKVNGNCSMCETAIENASNIGKTSKADWNEQTQMATITYDSMKTNVEVVLKNIALAGYDNEMFLAPDEAYNKLPACCKYQRENKTAISAQPAKDTMTTNKNHNDHQQAGMANSAMETSQLIAVFNSYFSLKDALVKTDENLASIKAADLKTAINAVKMEKLPMDVHIVWMKVLKELKEDAEHIYSNKEIADKRGHFIRLSNNMYELMKSAKTIEPIYYQFCPMANNGKGAYWLSKESVIKNPYYGSLMLTCGKTVETIK